MATYVTLFSYTQQGIQNVKNSPERLDKARELAKSLDMELKDFYLTMGEYDGLVVAQAPNPETVAKFLLTIGGMGNIRTKTFPVIPEAEFRKLIADLP